MKALFNYIKARINADVPEIKTVRMWNQQFQHSNGTDNKLGGAKTGYRDEKAFPYPACFIEFQVNDVNNYAMGIKDYFLTVRMRFGVQSYKFERLDTFDFRDNFDSMIQLMAPTALSGLTFTTFQEVQTEFDEDWNNVEVPYIDYRTRYRSATSYQRRTDIISTPDKVSIIINAPALGMRTINGGDSRVIHTGDFRSVATA